METIVHERFKKKSLIESQKLGLEGKGKRVLNRDNETEFKLTQHMYSGLLCSTCLKIGKECNQTRGRS